MTKTFDERNAEKSRAVCEAMDRENGRRALTERERRILEMWPRFEDGEPVMLGDKYEDNEGNECIASGVHFEIDGPSLVDAEGFHDLYRKYARVKRHDLKVLDADGVEIKKGDTVWMVDGVDDELLVEKFHDGQRVDCLSVYGAHEGSCINIRSANLTHTRTDSWERLEVDAAKGVCEYAGAEPCGRIDAHDCDTCRLLDESSPLTCEQRMCLDIVRRAKKLARVEVD